MNDEKEIGQKSRELFQQRETSLDPDTLKRLQDIRHEALEIAAQKQRSWLGAGIGRVGELLLSPQGHLRATPILTAAVASVLVVALILNLQYTSTAPIDDLMILTAGDDYEVIEDLDFYDWLLDVDQNG